VAAVVATSRWISRSAALQADEPAARPHAACVQEVKTPWQGKIKVVTNGSDHEPVIK
jgi:hypothetical protein